MDIFKKIIDYRRDFHKYAEGGWVEFRTSSIIAEELSRLGYEVSVGKEVIHEDFVMGRKNDEYINKHIDRAIEQGAIKYWIDKMDRYTGVVGFLDTKKDGPTIALRFDIDANDATEIKDEDHRPHREKFDSVNEEFMHACGHDGHAAIGMGVAQLLMDEKEKLCGKIKLIFQPAEEGVRGAKAMVKKGIVDDVDYFISGHIGFGYKTGEIVSSASGFLCTTKINSLYMGKGAHAGACPNEGNNALLGAANAVMNLHAISRHKDGPTRINVGRLNAGVGRNVIAPNAYMEIETRGINKEVNDYMVERVFSILKNTSQMYNLECEIEKAGEAIDFSSDEELKEIVTKVARHMEDVKIIEEEGILGGSEDATWFMERVKERGGKNVYVLIGADIYANHHNEWFDFNEDSLIIGTKLYMEIIKEILK